MPRHSRTHTVHAAPYTSFPGAGNRSGRRSTVLGRAYGAVRAGLPLIAAGLSRSSTMSSIRSARSDSGIRYGKVHNEGTGGQCSYFTGKKGKCYLPKHVENALAPQVQQGVAAGQLLSAIGKQNVVAPLVLNPPTICTAYTGDKISRVIYEKATGDVTLNNILLSNCYIHIYDIMARKDCSATLVHDPLDGWAQGDTDITTSGTQFQKLGATPFQSELFNQYFAIKQVTHVVLAAGATHVHKVRLNPNKIVSAAYANYTPYGLKDLTYWCMIEIHGSPANDTITQTQVSIGAGAINFVVDAEHTLKQLSKATPTITVVGSSLLTAFSNAEQVVNLGGSTIVTNAEG